MTTMPSIHSNSSLIKLPPRPPLSLALGALSSILGGKAEKMVIDVLVKHYGPVLTINMPMLGTLVGVFEPKLVRGMMSGSADTLISGRGNAVLSFLYGKTSVFLVDGNPHRRLRKLLVPPFKNKDALARYATVIEQAAEEMLEQLPEGKSFALLPYLRHAMLEIILKIVFGINDDAKLAPFRKCMTEILDISASYETGVRFALQKIGGITKWKRLQTVLKETDNLIFEEINFRRQHTDITNADDILALLLNTRTEDGDLLSDIEIRDQLMTLLIAGHETTATTLAWAIERLLHTPTALQKLLKENQQGKSDEYAQAVVQETLRLRPPIPFFSREVATSSFEFAGFNLPKGVNLIACLGYIQQREDLYEDAESFKPERFIDKKIETGTWTPFGGGLHSCIGNHFAELEVKIFLQVMFRRAVFKTHSQGAEWQLRKTILNLPMRGTRVTLLERKPKHLSSPHTTVKCPYHS